VLRDARAARIPEGAGPIEPRAALVIAAANDAEGNGMDAHFNGRISAPALFACALEEGAIDALHGGAAASALGLPLVAAWDFAADIGSSAITDVSGHRCHGTTVNLPTRGVVDHTFGGEEVSFRLAGGGYGAIHFHEDDLEDAGWEADASFTVPNELPSGIYAARLRAGEDEDHLPFVVRPAREGPRAAIAFLVPTLTYRAYANYLDVERGGWDTSDLPHLDMSMNPDVYSYILEEQLFGLYDRHADGSATCYGSSLRPILNMRPDWRYRIWGAPTLFAADLYLVDWLDEKGYEVDCITDDDLHREGAGLLETYRVILTGSHPEYWTAQMLDALESHLDGGGRLMYLGGNGFFGVASIDPLRPHVAEVRRWGTSWPFEAPPPERYHSTTGEPGGTWRNRGRAPNRLVGVGTCAAGFDSGGWYVRGPQAGDPRAAFVFEGLEPDEPIGDVPSLQVRNGAAGYEIDRHEPALGSPRDALVLASSVGHSSHYHAMLDEQLWFVDEVDGVGAGTPGTGGERVHPFIHADLVLWPRARGGAVFSVGSMAWQSCLSHNGYDNSVSRVTQNVLERFLREEPIE
jgi:N,N-dimethylformamidase